MSISGHPVNAAIRDSRKRKPLQQYTTAQIPSWTFPPGVISRQYERVSFHSISLWARCLSMRLYGGQGMPHASVPISSFNVIREHCRQGVDFLTLHCGVNREALAALKSDPRIMPVVSRGGAFHVAWMEQSGEENPLFSEFDYLLEILAEHEVVASLGDGMRPGCLQDARRHAKTVEYLNLGRLANRALDAGVQRMIEGPGHIPVRSDRVQCPDDQGAHQRCPSVPARPPGDRYRTGLRSCRGGNRWRRSMYARG